MSMDARWAIRMVGPAGAAGDRTAVHEPRVFGRLRWRLLRNHVGGYAGVSRFRIVMVLLSSALFWCGLFLLFFETFGFLNARLSADQVGYLFSAFFLPLFVMLVFSSGIIAYSGLYQSSETAFLLTTPARPDQIFAHKFQEVMLFSSWGFLLLGSPLLVAFSISAGAPWFFYVMLIFYLLAFVYLPTSMGALACVLVAHFFPRKRTLLLGVAAAGLVALAAVLAGGVLRGAAGSLLSDAWVCSVLDQMDLFGGVFLPSWWMSTGLLSAARGDFERALFFLLLILSNGMFFYLVTTVVIARLYRPSYSRVQTGLVRRHRYRASRFDALFHRVLFWIPLPLRLLIVKDLRAFRRDPVQWSQFLIYVGLLGLYFFMYPRIGGSFRGYPRYAISFLNVSVCALILSTFTTRFVFPMLSLEGRKFWILGLLPIRRESILWAKFAFAAGGSLLPTVVLVGLSDVALGVEPALLLVHALLVSLLCSGLAGISVGLGARLPNLREENPSKIAAGFGGTLNLVLSTAYIFAMLLLLALPAHVYFAGLQMEQSFPPWLHRWRLWFAGCMATGVLLAVAATLLPLRTGMRAFRKLEV